MPYAARGKKSKSGLACVIILYGAMLLGLLSLIFIEPSSNSKKGQVDRVQIE